IATFILGPIDSRNPLLDAPYSPLILAAAYLLGYATARHFETRIGQWVWIPGAVWILTDVFETLRSFDPKSCAGCTAGQYVWLSYFSTKYGEVGISEGLGQLLVTAPFLASIMYSLGAVMGDRSARKFAQDAKIQSINRPIAQ